MRSSWRGSDAALPPAGVWCKWCTWVLGAIALFAAISGLPERSAMAAGANPITIVAFGDSLTAGYELPPDAAFPVRLEKALKAKGHGVKVVNAGVSGDTTAAGLARFDWAVGPDTDAVILELGANDALRGLSPKAARKNLDTILGKLKSRGIEVLIAGMVAPNNWGEDYKSEFDGMFGELAKTYGAIHYPFLLEGVAGDPNLNLRDGLHPNPKGVDVIVSRILPKVEELVGRVSAKRETAIQN